MQRIKVEYLGLIDYKSAWDYQETLFDALIRSKLGGNPKPGHLLFCEHPHVFTLGRHGMQNNLLIKDSFLKTIDATFYKINRGGDITYHGPGQIVCYPIIDLDFHGIGIRDYIEKLESSVIRLLRGYGMEGYRLDKITGVWMKDPVTGTDRKICAIGVRASRGITMHGLAFNVNTDLAYFNYINPCGIQDKGVTSLSEQNGMEWDMNEVCADLLDQMDREFGFGLEQ